MHPNPRRIAPIVVIIIILSALAYWFFIVRPAQADNGELSASGTIEAVQVRIIPELGGRVLEVLAAKGDTVQVGDPLVQIDPSLLNAQREQAVASLEAAQANADATIANADAASLQINAAEAAQGSAQAALDAANANLALLEAGATTEQLTAAQAQITQAQANYQAALASFAALTAGARPEDINTAKTLLAETRDTYYGLVVTLNDDQIGKFEDASDQADTYIESIQEDQTKMKDDVYTPVAVINALPAALQDAENAQSYAQAALDAANDSSLPFYQQMEAAKLSVDAADLAHTQAKARQDALRNVDDITDGAKDALQANVDYAKDMYDAAKKAYDGINNADQGRQLQNAWRDVQGALTDLNQLARGSSTPLESVVQQLDAAQALGDAAQANYDNLAKGARPEQLAAAQAQVTAAQGQLDGAGANLSSAQARATAAEAQAKAAQAQVEVAQAALDVIDVQISKLALIAPNDGTVLARSVEPGELAAPGATLMVLADLSQLTITVYVPEDRYGQIDLGQQAEVKVDSFPDQTFTATVTHIADEAEFTPRNVQTADGRKTTVFAVELSIDNSNGKLKPGMPADVTIK